MHILISNENCSVSINTVFTLYFEQSKVTLLCCAYQYFVVSFILLCNFILLITYLFKYSAWRMRFNHRSKIYYCDVCKFSGRDINYYVLGCFLPFFTTFIWLSEMEERSETIDAFLYHIKSVLGVSGCVCVITCIHTHMTLLAVTYHWYWNFRIFLIIIKNHLLCLSYLPFQLLTWILRHPVYCMYWDLLWVSICMYRYCKMYCVLYGAFTRGHFCI